MVHEHQPKSTLAKLLLGEVARDSAALDVMYRTKIATLKVGIRGRHDHSPLIRSRSDFFSRRALDDVAGSLSHIVDDARVGLVTAGQPRTVHRLGWSSRSRLRSSPLCLSSFDCGERRSCTAAGRRDGSSPVRRQLGEIRTLDSPPRRSSQTLSSVTAQGVAGDSRLAGTADARMWASLTEYLLVSRKYSLKPMQRLRRTRRYDVSLARSSSQGQIGHRTDRHRLLDQRAVQRCS